MYIHGNIITWSERQYYTNMSTRTMPCTATPEITQKGQTLISIIKCNIYTTHFNFDVQHNEILSVILSPLGRWGLNLFPSNAMWNELSIINACTETKYAIITS